MTRPKAFDETQALEQAMTLFWERGYEAASVEDLLRAMGINRASLYGTYGDKRSLFLAATRLYEERMIETLARELGSAESPLQAVRTVFASKIEACACPQAGWRGCLLANTLVELGPHDPEVRAHVRENLSRIEALLYGKLMEAQAQGELSQHAKVRALARLLTGTMLTLATLSKVSPGKEVLEDIAREALATLDGASTPREFSESIWNGHSTMRVPSKDEHETQAEGARN